MKSYLLTSIMTWVVQWKDGQSVKFALTRDSSRSQTRLWQINPRYKYDPDPNNKTKLICQKSSFSILKPPLFSNPSLYIFQWKGSENQIESAKRDCTVQHFLDTLTLRTQHSLYFSKFSVHQSRQDSGENYNFVTSEAKRNFLRSQPSSPCRSGHAITSGGELQSWQAKLVAPFSWL